MEILVYQVDAFTSEVFGGNPAAVCPLQSWPEEALLQKIAAENNLSETAFFVGEGEGYRLRWFTPLVEVDLCGHATLASAWVIFHYLNIHLTEVRFESMSGPLVVRREGARLALDFPSRPPEPCSVPEGLAAALGAEPREVLRSRDLMAVFETEEQVRGLTPDVARLSSLEAFGLIATAPGKNCDFVSRYFAPKEGIPEDPVTGSAHCTLIPYWGRRMGKEELFARQVSSRGGVLYCRDRGDRVEIAGEVALYMEGTIRV